MTTIELMPMLSDSRRTALPTADLEPRA